MEPIKIPAIFLPDDTIKLGYPGGMALFVAHWESVLLLYEPTNVPRLSFMTIQYSEPLN